MTSNRRVEFSAISEILEVRDVCREQYEDLYEYLIRVFSLVPMSSLKVAEFKLNHLV